MAKKGRLNTKFIIQLGILVKDIDAVAKEWGELLDMEVPEAHLNNPYEVTQATYNGEACPARIKQISFALDNLQVELITPVGDEPSFWRDCLEKNGEGFHHLAFSAQHTDNLVEKMTEKGMKMIQKGEFQSGRYAYYDSFDKLKLYIESLEIDHLTDEEFEQTNLLAKHDD
ncbi:MAG: VOC family protein [Lactovum sp.]